MSTPGFKIKNTGGASTIYSSGLWIGALDGSDSLHIAGVMYGIDNDFFGGPISVDYSDSLDWKKTWVISKSEIDEFNDFFACQSNPLCDESSVFPNYVIPNVISSWPAHGDISQNEDFYIAPFIDLNLDGFYNPADGDYPCIKGDQMIFSIFNDFYLRFRSIQKLSFLKFMFRFIGDNGLFITPVPKVL